MKWIKGLNSLRFILAITVLLSHMQLSQIIAPSGNAAEKISRLLIGNSFVGVAAVITFFIISGIVIHLPYKNKLKVDMPVNYLAKRYLRIGIPMIAVVLIAYVYNLEIGIFPFWSLYCELFYYTLYPLILIFIRKIGTNKVLVGSFILSYIIIIIYSNNINDFIYQNKIYNGNYWQLGVFKTCLVGLPCWLLGVKITEDLNVIFSLAVTRKKIWTIRVTVLVIAFLCSVARFHFSLSYLLSLNLFAVLAYYWIKYEIIYWKNKHPALVLENAGKWSYSLYLCHALGIILIPHLFPSANITAFLILQIISSLAISYLFYLMIEKPSHKIIRKIKLDF